MPQAAPTAAPPRNAAKMLSPFIVFIIKGEKSLIHSNDENVGRREREAERKSGDKPVVTSALFLRAKNTHFVCFSAFL